MLLLCCQVWRQSIASSALIFVSTYKSKKNNCINTILNIKVNPFNYFQFILSLWKVCIYENVAAEATVTTETFVLQQYGGKRRRKLMIYS